MSDIEKKSLFELYKNKPSMKIDKPIPRLSPDHDLNMETELGLLQSRMETHKKWKTNQKFKELKLAPIEKTIIKTKQKTETPPETPSPPLEEPSSIITDKGDDSEVGDYTSPIPVKFDKNRGRYIIIEFPEEEEWQDEEEE